jgi:thiosulfate/3-mercaptopyruvate sulfurtransferase
MDPLITPHELARILDEPKLRIVDTSFELGRPAEGRAAYERAHLPGAVHLDLERDLSSPAGVAGRHPLPDPEELATRLGALGIGDEHRVVAYDGGQHMFATRMWWLLHYLGHDRVQVLDGGWPAWCAAGLPTSRDVPTHAPASFSAQPRAALIADREHVRAALGDTSTLLIDARAPARYRGDEEPLDPRAGHLPGAINLPYADNFYEGTYRSPEELRRRFEPTSDAAEVILYCGSGVSATANALAMRLAGLPLPRVYVGSWSEWCRDAEAPIETGSPSRTPVR